MTTPDLESKVRKILRKLQVPGAIVSLRSQVYTPFTLLYGHANLDGKIRVKSNDVFRIGSVTKTFTGIVFLQLYQEGKVKLNDPVSKYLVGIPDGDKITISDIGYMRSGIANYFLNPQVDAAIDRDPLREYIPAELFASGITLPQVFSPGTNFQYSNTNTIILGLIIERLTGKSLAVNITERIIRPLRLRHTVFQEGYRLPRPHMDGYECQGQDDDDIDPPAPLVRSNKRHLGHNENITIIAKRSVRSPSCPPVWNNITDFNMSIAWAAGAISSVISDMHRYAKYAIGKHVFLDRKATHKQRTWMSSRVIEPYGLVESYGFQLIKLGTFLGHNGSIPGYNTYVLCEIETRTTLVIAVNAQTNCEGVKPADYVAQYMVAYLNGRIC